MPESAVADAIRSRTEAILKQVGSVHCRLVAAEAKTSRALATSEATGCVQPQCLNC